MDSQDSSVTILVKVKGEEKYHQFFVLPETKEQAEVFCKLIDGAIVEVKTISNTGV